MILAGDIGGTNSRLALFDPDDKRIRPVVWKVYPNAAYEGLAEIVMNFLSDQGGAINYACFGVACPVRKGWCEMPNLSWVIDSSQLARDLTLDTVEIINDLEANAYGIAVLQPDDFAVLSKGTVRSGGNAAIIAAGTGLGEAGLYWNGNRYQPFPSEGGHADFAPRNRLEVDLFLYLSSRSEHVSVERVLSGPGLYNIYRFLRDTGREEEPDWLAESMSREDPPTVITRLALEERSEICGRALDIFVSIYGAEGGNLALKMMATGGLFLGGGIAPRIVEKLKNSTFMESFTAKGRMETLLQTIPVKVILNDKTALLGAAYLATLRLSDS